MKTKPLHPGEYLAEELAELNMSATDLARRIKVPTNRITEIINCERRITGDTAIRLARVFRISPHFWLHLQNIYEVYEAKENIGHIVNTFQVITGRNIFRTVKRRRRDHTEI